MNITKEAIDSLNAVVKIKLTPEDYQPQVEAELKKYQKTAKMPGFRPGKVPAAMIKKMYGKSILADGLNKLLSEQLNKYISDNNLDVLGNPLPKEDGAAAGDFENPSDFEFLFELGLAPQFELNIDPSKTFTKYEVEVDSDMLEKELANIRRRYGKFTTPDAASENDILYGDFVELNDDGSEKENGLKASSTIAIDLIKDEAEKAKFIGIAKDAVVTFNPMTAYQNATEVGAIFGIKKEEAENIKSNFSYTVKSVNHIEKAELNQELFDKVLGENKVTSEGEFTVMLQEQIAGYYNNDAERKLSQDMIDSILESHNLNLPAEFLKRWLMAANDKPITMEQINAEFDDYAKGLKWRLIENKILKTYNIEVSPEEVKEFSKEMMRAQFAQYGQMNVDDATLDSMVNNYLSKEDTIRKTYENLAGKKVFEFLRNTFQVNSKQVALEDFANMLNA